jgi:hypothetical protein
MKKDLMESIGKLPLFELKPTAILCNQEWVEQEFKGVTEVGQRKAIEMVSNQYRLVQFQDLFRTAIERLPEEIEGRIWYFWGLGEMDVFPTGEEVGLIIKNSVDRRQAVRIDFGVRADGETFSLPTEIKGFKRIHKGTVVIESKDFLAVIKELKPIWKNIITTMNTVKLDGTRVQELLALRMNKRLKEVIAGLGLGEVTLWQAFTEIVRAISKRKYKSPLHRRMKLRQVGDVIFDYCLQLKVP